MGKHHGILKGTALLLQGTQLPALRQALRPDGRELAILPLAFVAIFFLYPLLSLLTRSWEGGAIEGLFSLFEAAQNNTPLFYAALYQATLSTLLAAALGLPLAWVLSSYSFTGKRFVRALTLVPFVLPSVLVVLAFVLIFGVNGLFNKFLFLLGASEPLRFLYGPAGIVLAHAFYNFPLIARLVSNAWTAQDPSLLQAARTLGATPLHAFTRITLPRLLPALFAGGALVFLYSFMSFAIVLTFGGVSFTTVEVGIYQALARSLDLSTASSLALLQFAVLALVIYLYARLGGRQKSEALKPLFLPALNLRTRRGALAGGILLSSALIVLLPLLSLMWFAFFDPRTQGPRATLAPLLKVFTPSSHALLTATPLSAVFNSILFGLLAAMLATLMALAWVLGKKPAKGAFSTLLVATLALSPLALATGYILAFPTGHWGWIILGHSLLSFPFALRAVTQAHQRISPSLWDAARTLGADTITQLRRVGLPLMKSGLVASFAFAFAISLSELGLALTLGHGQWVTLPVYILRFLSAFNLIGAVAMGLVLAAVGAFAFYVIERFAADAAVV